MTLFSSGFRGNDGRILATLHDLVHTAWKRVNGFQRWLQPSDVPTRDIDPFLLTGEHVPGLQSEDWGEACISLNPERNPCPSFSAKSSSKILLVKGAKLSYVCSKSSPMQRCEE